MKVLLTEDENFLMLDDKKIIFRYCVYYYSAL